jgi:hypothetical protein
MVQEDRVDALYGLPLEEFTSARKKLADELRAGGEREAAKHVAGLSKPTTAAWAVNQLMRTQRKDARALLDAGERLRKAHEATAAGNASVRDLREAVDAERKAIERLTRAARGLTNKDGRELSENTLERVRHTLHAVSVDSEARSLAQAGRLSRELQASAAGAFAIPAGKARGGKVEARRPAQVQKMHDRLERARNEARDLRSERTQAARAVSDVERALARARREMRKADQRVTDKEAEIEQLRRKLDQLK